MLGGSFDEIEARAQALEADGYDGGVTAETSHDPFFPLLLAAAGHRARSSSRTGVAIAFARTPMTLASIANDLQLASKGRFSLGLGSQIKPHIERRFSMPWSHPAARMREFMLAMRAIWAAWNGGEKLDFRGEFYTHTLMTPFFDPGPNPYGPPKVMLAAVGDLMTEVAGEVADGMILHPFTTERYVREVTLPGARARLRQGGPHPRRLHAQRCPVFVVTGTTDEEWATARNGHQAADRVLRLDARLPRRAAPARLGRRRHRAQPAVEAQGEWVEMGELITDEMLETFAVVADARRRSPAAIVARYGDVARPPQLRRARTQSDPEVWTSVLASSRPPR